MRFGIILAAFVLCAAHGVRAQALDAGPPPLRAVPSFGSLRVSEPPLVLGAQGQAALAERLRRVRLGDGRRTVALGRQASTSVLWQGTGSYGDTLYGLSTDDNDMAIGASPLVSGLAATGYAAGFRYGRGDWELRGDLRTGSGHLAGLRTQVQGISAALDLSSSVTLRLEYTTRAFDLGPNSARDSRVGGGLEFGF
ncbi:MAG: hypothetical protein GF320_05305 [Armatimonadia bacterium]|nr:hypothetical protein [Armatimonadia bacterium]